MDVGSVLVSPPASASKRKPLSHVVGRYDSVAPLYRPLEPVFLVFPYARRRAVAALALKPGDTVLEIGAGTGRNFRYLTDAVGPTGRVIAVDASPGMLAVARKAVRRNGWDNVKLLKQNAGELDVDEQLDAVLFSLSYSVIPDPKPALACAWARLRPGSRVVVMDAGLTHSPLGRILGPVAKQLVKLAPGDPYSEPWKDLATYGEVRTVRFLLGLYFVCTVEKPSN